MASKYMNTSDEENPKLPKHIGCMTGIFGMFDRHHLLSRRRLGEHIIPKSLPSEHALISDGSLGREHSGCSIQIVQEKNSKSLHENQRISMESSRTSLSSSSCSSSFSSLECNKSTQQEPPSDQTIFSGRILINSPDIRSSNIDTKPSYHELCKEPQKASAQPRRRSLNFQEVVKDSIYKDAHCLSVKTSTKEEEKVKRHILKHIDSPRPMPLAKSRDGSSVIGIDRKSKMHVDVNESLRVLVKLKEAPWNFSEVSMTPTYETKDGSFYLVANEMPRFSYDGRESSRTSLDSRENSRSGSKLRELPRLSLDSRSSTFGSKQNSILKDLDRSSISQKVPSALKLEQESASHKCLPGVVAKLMGLEAMPNLSLVSQETVYTPKTNTNKYVDAINGKICSISVLNSSNAAQNIKEDHKSCSAKSTPLTPRLKSQDPVKKSISNSRIPIESTPWRQQDGAHVMQKSMFKYRKSRLKQQNESVYSEIEKRLKDLEFQKSNKDLRALKQILDAMQAKGLLETEKGGHQQTDSSVQKKNIDQIPIEVDQRASTQKNPVEREAPLRGFHSPIVIVMPEKSIKKSDVSESSVIPLESLADLPKLRINVFSDKMKTSPDNRMAKDQIPKANGMEHTSHPSAPTDKKSCKKAVDNNPQRTVVKMIQDSARSQQTQKENSSSPVKHTSSVSPRLQQRMLDAEKKAHPSLPSSDSNKPPIKPSSDSVSPRNKQRRKPARLQQNNEQLNETSSPGQHADEISIVSDSSISFGSQVDVEVTSAYRSVASAELSDVFYQQSNHCPSTRAAYNVVPSVARQKFIYSSKEDVSTKDLETVAPEQPSPISVLDASFYRDDLPPSPARRFSYEFKDNESRTSTNRCSITDIDSTCLSKSSSEINQKLKKIENLIQRLGQLSSAKDDITATDHIASLCETHDPDHRYVSEILLASGLLMKDLSPGSPMPVQLHSSGHPINPNLFLVLEQTKSGWLPIPEDIYANKRKPDLNKLHRKFVFDLVNEILVQKLNLMSPVLLTNPYCRVRKLTAKFPSGQQMLKELCSEIDRLQFDGLKGSYCDEDSSITREDVLHQTQGWEDFKKEVPMMVLEIERLIFKDLIDEVLSGEDASEMQTKANR